MNRCILLFLASVIAINVVGETVENPMVDLATVDRTIRIELRYATNRNISGQAIYPAKARCLVRRGVAWRLMKAQRILSERGFGLKIWDAYRPAAAQRALWELVRRGKFVANPDKQHSLHNWGAAVDATLVDNHGKEIRMPSDFDDFSDAAKLHYEGGNAEVARNLATLKGAMGAAGFLGMRSEWWHFVAANWREYGPIEVTLEKPTRR